jgi:Flp pilus assembly protein TadG
MNKVLKTFYRHDDSGVITPLMLVLLIGIFLMTGIALDLLRQETERADLQNALDRGVLAAASLSQTVDAEVTIRDYLNTRSFSDSDLTVTIGTEGGLNSRQVIAGAEYDMDTIFLRLAGLNQLQVPARSAAVQSVENVEVSLALDISGTMRYDNRLPNLQPAANAFIDTVISNGVAQRTTINLVPYAGQVNPGPAVFNMLGGVREHNNSSCLEFTASDFDSTGLPAAGSYAQVPNFHHWPIDRGWMDWGWCPSDDTAIAYMSNDVAALQSEIDNIRLHDGTGTYNAMKWALALLDPTSQPTIASLASSGIVDPAFASRPAAWNDSDTFKVIVLMTDGQITEQNRPDNPGNPALDTEEVLVYGHPYSQTVPRSTGLAQFYALCDMAKNNGVTIYTIAFEAPAAARQEMMNCATSLGHFYDVEGLEIDSAFEQIGDNISKLKLVM